jgi:lipopolysaccharide heptosyltransferase II
MKLPRFLRSSNFFRVQSQRLNPRGKQKLKRILRSRAVRLLVIRPDRLGDVILSTPTLEVIKKRYPKVRLTVLVRAGVAPLLKGLSSVDEVLIFDPEKRHAGFQGFWRLVEDLRGGEFEFSVALQSNWKIAVASYLAGIPRRVGPLSKVHSYLFYNLGLRQRRSQVEMHESDYNLQLLKRVGVEVSSRVISTQVHLSQAGVRQAEVWLSEKGWTPEGGTTLIIHPGMGGSALNWPETHYHDLARSLVSESFQVIVTGGPQEVPLLDEMEKALSSRLTSASGRLIFFKNTGSLGVDFLAGLFSHAQLVVAPSTGPLHLAVALQIPVVTFFPPIRVQSAVRWGPYLADDSRASILVPEVYCGQDFKCRGTACHYYPCMKSLTVNQAIEQVRLQIQKDAPHPSKG